AQDVALEFLQGFRLEAQLGHVEPQIFFVEKPEDDFFTVQGWDGGNAEVQFLPLAVSSVLDHDAAILREALFGDVELRHDLHAAGDGVLEAKRRRRTARWPRQWQTPTRRPAPR